MRHVTAKTFSTGPWVRRASLAGLGASLLPSLSFGLGLGDIQVESHLNQPLHARIEVVDVSDDEWRQIRVRVAPRTLLSEGSVHPELLASLSLRAVEDTKGGHFIEVKSGDVLTEPLFDLPVEVAGQSLQVVRNYSVLLDPAMSEDAPRSVPAAVVAQATGGVRAGGAAREEAPLAAGGAAGGHYATVAQVGGQHGARRHRTHGARKHSKASRKVAHGTHTAGVSNSVSAPSALASVPPVQAETATATKTSGQEELQGQLETLQQTLIKMQATIASQNAEIAKLTAQVAARSESQASQRPSTWVEYPARKSEVSSEESDAPSGWLSARSGMFYWIGGIVAGIVVVAFGVVRFLRWRHAKMLHEIALNEAARRQSAPKPAVAPTSERDLLAWQSNLRAAQSGMWKQSPDLESAPASTSEDTVATTVAIEELTQDLEADLESLNASYEAEHLETTSGGTVAWRTQNEMLERDYLSDTEALPYVPETGERTLHEGKDDTDSDLVEKIAI